MTSLLARCLASVPLVVACVAPATPAPGASVSSPLAAAPTVVSSPAAAGPTPSPTPSPLVIPGTGVLVRSDAARSPASADAARRAALAVEALSADLYRERAKEDGNLILSPYSVAIALAMTRLGASGTTATEMDAILRASSVGDLHAGFNALDQELARRPGKYPYGATTVDLELATANQLWAQRGFAFYQGFIDKLAASYGAGMRLVDYRGAPEEARRDINGWVADRTRDRIPEVLAPGTLGGLTRFVLTNALYMKAKWTVPFAKGGTIAGAFHRLDGRDSEVQFMGGSGYHGYAEGPGYQAVQLNYVGGLSMAVIVPDAGSFRAFEASLDPARLRTVLAGLGPTSEYVALRLPRFRFRTVSPLNETLSTLGMRTAFTDRSDLSAMSPEGQLAIQQVAHQAFIAVDEDGTEAAAATAFVGGATGGPSRIIDMVVDRPFLFLVRDNETGAILFTGRVVDPAIGTP